jgi:hypothetical protein
VLRDKRDVQGALARYQAADSIMHVTTTGLAVARAQAELGLLVEAHDTLVDLMRIPPKPNEPAVLSEARVAARALSDELEGRIPALRVHLLGTAEATVAIDGATIPPASIIGDRRVNPGRHVVTARVGTVERREDVTLAERERRDVTFDFGAPAPQVFTLADSQPKTTAAARVGPFGALAFTGFGIGAAGVIAGSITGLVSISKANAAKAIPANQGGCVSDNCGPATHSDIDTSETLGNVSTVAFLAGGAGLVLGVSSLVVWRSRARSQHDHGTAAHATMQPWVGPAFEARSEECFAPFSARGPSNSPRRLDRSLALAHCRRSRAHAQHNVVVVRREGGLGGLRRDHAEQSHSIG